MEVGYAFRYTRGGFSAMGTGGIRGAPPDGPPGRVEGGEDGGWEQEAGMRRAIALVVGMLPQGCGTVRYRVAKPVDGGKARTELQWGVVELRFNELWRGLFVDGGK